MSQKESESRDVGGSRRGDAGLRIRLDKTVRGGAPIGSQSCNLHCLVCHNDYFFYPDHSIKAISNHTFLDAVDKVIAASQASWSIIYLAGSGEPTVVGATELTDLICRLKQIPEVTTIRMITNGVLLGDMALSLKQAGLDGVRVSINTLDKEVYSFYTGVSSLGAAIEGIERSLEAGLEVKLNVIYSKLNSREIEDFVQFSLLHEGIVVKFFNVLPNNHLSERLYLPITHLERSLGRRASRVVDLDQFYTSRIFELGPSGKVQVKGFSANSCPNLLCESRALCLEDCRDMVRIGLDGIMRPCGVRKDNIVNLIDPAVTEENIREALRSGGKIPLQSAKKSGHEER